MLAGHGSPMLGSARRCESRIGSAQTSYPTLRRRGRYRHLHLLLKTFKFGGCPIHKHQPSITEGCFYIILTGVVRVLCISMFGQIRCADRGSSLEILRLILFASFTRFASGWLEKLTDRSSVNTFLSQISFVFAYGLGVVCYSAELRRLIFSLLKF